MKIVDRSSGLDVLDRDECYRLLAEEQVGRLGIVANGRPLILPVNFDLDEAAIVFRTAPGTKLHAGPKSPACFQVDRFDDETRSGWSVLASGELHHVDSFQHTTWRRLQDLEVDPWAEGARPHWMRLRVERISGRKVGGQAPPSTGSSGEAGPDDASGGTISSR